MAIYVYAAEACREEARKHSVEPQLDRIIKKVESDQSYSQFQPFPAPFLVKKKFGMYSGPNMGSGRTLVLGVTKNA